MKKLLALLLAVVLVFGLAACSTDNKKENSTDGTISETQTDTTPSTENTETTEPSTEVTTPSDETTEGTEETTPPTEGSTNTESKPTEETSKKEDNKKEDTKTETTTSPTERPVVKDEDLNSSSQKKDDTMFNSYESFVQNSVTSESFSLSSAPSNLTALKPVCDCNIKFSGNLKNGSVEVTINGVGHGHSWGTAELHSVGKTTTNKNVASAGVSVSSPNGQMLVACGQCGFVKGENFIFVKIPGKSHGHGWSWPMEKVENKTCHCLDFLTGDFENGSYSPKVYGVISGSAPYICGHGWSTSKSVSTGVSAGATAGASASASVGTGIVGNVAAVGSSVSESVSKPHGLTGVPPCQHCGFRKYENIYGSKIITFKCLENGGSHTIDFTTFHKIGEKVNCPCGLTTSGNKANGSFSFSSKYSNHGHGWATSVSVGSPNTHSSSGEGWSTGASHSVGGTIQGVTNSESWSNSTSHSTGSSIVSRCSCEQEDVENGFIVKCPATNKYHVINYS